MRKFKNEAADITKYTYKNYLYIVNTRRPNISPLALFAFNSISEEENVLRPTYSFFFNQTICTFQQKCMRLIDSCFFPYLSGHDTLNIYGQHFTKCVNCHESIKQ